MNASIKRRQTLLATFLYKQVGCKPISIAETGSLYAEYNTLYSGKSVIRISNHLSNKRDYIHVILNPLNTTVIINYKNFMWNGDFATSKQILFSLIMSKSMVELAPKSPSNTKDITSTISTSKKKKSYSFEDRVKYFGEKLAKEIRIYKNSHPQYMKELREFVEIYHPKSKKDKQSLWETFKSKHK